MIFSPASPSSHALPRAAALWVGPHGILSGASPQAGRTEWLYLFIFGICLAAYIITVAWFSIAGAKSHVASPAPLPIEDNKEGDRRAAWAVGSAIAVTVGTLFVVLVVSVVTGKRVEGLTSKNPVTIQITGHQWWWEAEYPSPQPDQIVITANEIHVPVGVPVVLLTKSQDVIHSFWAPSIGGKRDLIPGYQTAYWFKVNKPGRYRGQCAEFCGLQHAHMGFSLVAQSPEEFADWKRQQLQPAAESTNPEAIRGRQVFLTHACVLCHSIRGTDAASRYGPDLTHVASREMIAAETLPNTAGSLAGWIADPQSIKPGNKMAPNPLSPDDLQAVVTYLQTLH